MESTLYSKLFKKILEEDSFSGTAGVFGDTQLLYDPNNGDITSGDTYASGDARNILSPKKKKPIVTSRDGKVSPKSTKKQKSSKKIKKKEEKFIYF